ncbi:c-type cytochrome [Mucilaginibacter sp. BT774]|uniref:c-type cytochrome n=1 Tax=Mucilaginibacter sp. BT774 TaxID=3062276 RepID=UPI002676FD66|nr:c-type cytochrome [Mucilaginibacter sp. BT774]MDO3627001.1 c-type cytochrome [Mucilaginibacter sp. BT774]
MKRPLIIITAILAVLYACTHDVIKPSGSSTSSSGTGTTSGTGTGTGNGSGNGSGTSSVCFQTDVLPLFQTYCASTGCHDAGTAQEGLVLTNYANIMKGISANNPNDSKYYNVISDGSMPPRNSPKLSAAQVATILKWINQGATNNTCTVATCDTTKTTYTNGVSQIFATYCNGCHGVAPGSGGVVLSDYASAKTAGTTMKVNFLNAINYTSTTSAMNMPQSGKLPDCQITQITKWINNGCPQ